MSMLPALVSHLPIPIAIAGVAAVLAALPVAGAAHLFGIYLHYASAKVSTIYRSRSALASDSCSAIQAGKSY